MSGRRACSYPPSRPLDPPYRSTQKDPPQTNAAGPAVVVPTDDERRNGMTETVSGASNGRAAAPAPRKGARLRIERVYTTPGVHPYDEVEWERRDVVMTNWRDGSVNFEQRGVEFPVDWSVNAANIVTTKYFRGAVGTDQRESSLRQLIDRVVMKYVGGGLDHGYFASDDDAVVFQHELTYMLMHQIFSFNSPVWFNVGTTSPQQVSASFILAVDNTMDSILNWYREEGLSSRAAPAPASTSPASARRRS